MASWNWVSCHSIDWSWECCWWLLNETNKQQNKLNHNNYKISFLFKNWNLQGNKRWQVEIGYRATQLIEVEIAVDDYWMDQTNKQQNKLNHNKYKISFLFKNWNLQVTQRREEVYLGGHCLGVPWNWSERPELNEIVVCRICTNKSSIAVRVSPIRARKGGVWVAKCKILKVRKPERVD